MRLLIISNIRYILKVIKVRCLLLRNIVSTLITRLTLNKRNIINTIRCGKIVSALLSINIGMQICVVSKCMHVFTFCMFFIVNKWNICVIKHTLLPFGIFFKLC